jgi:hypothetical protein
MRKISLGGTMLLVAASTSLMLAGCQKKADAPPADAATPAPAADASAAPAPAADATAAAAPAADAAADSAAKSAASAATSADKANMAASGADRNSGQTGK